MANKTFNDVKLNMTLKVQSTRANLSSSKEDMAVQMGKIQKWYTDFTPLVFSKKKVDGVTFDQDIIHYATCSTAASTTSKTVDCTGFNLVTGAWILVRFTVTNTGAVANLTLNVNSTGAKSIKYRNANLSSAGVLAANRTYMFVYDGTYYQLIGDLDTNTDHITTATTSGSGNAVTAITADANGALTVTKGSTFLTSTTNYALSDSVGGDALRAKSLAVWNASVANQIVETDKFVPISSHSSTGSDFYGIGFSTSDENCLIQGVQFGIGYTNSKAQILTYLAFRDGGTGAVEMLTQSSLTADTGISLTWDTSGSVNKFKIGHSTISTSTTTTTASPAHGGTFTAIDSITTSNGHITKINTKTITLPADNNTDTKVTQTNTTGSAAYRVLLSGNANDTTETTTARKSANLQFNPSTGVLTQSGTTFGGIIVTRSGSANGASIAFENSNGILGYIGFTGDADSDLKRWFGSDTGMQYTVHDTRNTSYTATVTSSTSGQYTIGTLKLGGSNVTIYGKDTVYTHPSEFTAKTTAGFYKYTVDTNGHVSAGAALTKSDITGLGISASDHTHSNYLGAVNANGYYGMAEPDGTDSSWIRTSSNGILPYQKGALGSGHCGIGTSTWSFSNSYIDNMYSRFICIADELPQLKFQQKTSGSEYNNSYAGIKCYAADTYGMTMTIQSGGNMIIGGGEFPTNFYNATKFTAESYTSTGEKTYIGSDDQIFLIANGNTIANRHVFAFGMHFQLAIGGNVIFRYGTYDSYTSHSLTSAATTTARTWTLPDKTGTIALTSDLVDTKVTQSAATGNNYRPLIMGNKYSSTAGASTLQDTVTAQVYTNASIYANPSTGTIYANKFNDYPLGVGSTITDSWGTIPVINGADGVMEVGKYLDFHNSDDSTVDYDVRLYTNSTIQLLFKTANNTAGSNFSPHASNAFDLGTSSLKWRNVYATTFNGNATSATQDGSGNTITTTYLAGQDSGWIQFTISNSSVSDSALYYRKYGNVVTVCGTIKLATNASSTVSLATLPSGYRPKYSIFQILPYMTTNMALSGAIQILGDNESASQGAISLVPYNSNTWSNGSLKSGGDYYISVTFVTA